LIENREIRLQTNESVGPHAPVSFLALGEMTAPLGFSKGTRNDLSWPFKHPSL
jgi:hypothetical protein